MTQLNFGPNILDFVVQFLAIVQCFGSYTNLVWTQMNILLQDSLLNPKYPNIITYVSR